MLGSSVQGILHDMPKDALKSLGMGNNGQFGRTFDESWTGLKHSF